MSKAINDDIREILGFWQEQVEELTLEEVLMFYRGAAVVNQRIKRFDLDIELPTYLYEIIGLLSKGNPAFALMIFIDILEAKTKDAKIPKGYKITVEDFKATYEEDKWPYWDDAETNNEYHEKWLKQKDWDLPGTDNKIDYPEFWAKYFE